MFELIPPGTKINFVGYRKLWIAISIIGITVSLALLLFKGLNYGIDFTGGAEVQVQVPGSWDIGKIREELDKADLKGISVQQIGIPVEGVQAPFQQYLVKAQGDASSLNVVSEKIGGALAKTLKAGEFEIQRVDVVGPAAGSSLRMSGFLSMLYALVCILIYVTIRFDMRYSPGAVLALFHDTILVLGILVITQKTFDLQIIAAILALIGYSNNDTIIVFDRVRETLHTQPNLNIEESVNLSVNETLSRTLLTSVSSFVTVFMLWLIGGKVIHDFAFTLMVGIIIGTYSSIFIGSTLVIEMTKFFQRREAKQKMAGKTA